MDSYTEPTHLHQGNERGDAPQVCHPQSTDHDNDPKMQLE